MEFYFSSETTTWLNRQSVMEFQPSLYTRPQSPSFQLFTNGQAKQPSFFQDNLFNAFMETDSHQTESFSPSDFVSLDNNEISPSYFESFFDKDSFYDKPDFTLSGTIQSSTQKLIDKNQEKSQYQQIKSPESETIGVDISQTTSESPTTDETVPINDRGMKGWNQDDEKLLRQLAAQYKFDWKKIAKKFDNKKYTPHFLKMRYKGYDEGPVPKRVKFTHEEDMMIARYFAEYGVDWEKMATHFLNRTPVMLKNRYYSHIRKNKRLESLLKEMEKPEAGCVENYTTSSDELSCLRLSSEDKYSQSHDRMTEVSEEEARKSEEVALLRAQVKSLKSLCLITHKELAKLKNKRQRGKPNYVI